MEIDNEGLGYWLQWQVFVCALTFIVPIMAALVMIYRSRTAQLSAVDLWKPCWRKLHPVWLLVFRLFACLFMSFLLYQIVAVNGAFSFYFYTQWTFALVIVYFVLGTMISAHGCWVYSKEQSMEDEERDRFLKTDLEESKSATLTFRKHEIWSTIKLQSHYEQETVQRAGFWGYLMQIVFQTCAGAMILTDIVFWCLIVPFFSVEHFSVNLLMGCMHSVNAAFLLLDTAINSLPFPWFRLSYFILWSCAYVIFQWILHACGFSWWPYPFLELSTSWAPLWYFSLAVIHIPCYGMYYLIVKVKYSIFPKIFPHAFIWSC